MDDETGVPILNMQKTIRRNILKIIISGVPPKENLDSKRVSISLYHNT